MNTINVIIFIISLECEQNFTRICIETASKFILLNSKLKKKKKENQICLNRYSVIHTFSIFSLCVDKNKASISAWALAKWPNFGILSNKGPFFKHFSNVIGFANFNIGKKNYIYLHFYHYFGNIRFISCFWAFTVHGGRFINNSKSN